MRQPLLPCLLLLGLVAGCAGGYRQSAAHYPWLQKQGRRPADPHRAASPKGAPCFPALTEHPPADGTRRVEQGRPDDQADEVTASCPNAPLLPPPRPAVVHRAISMSALVAHGNTLASDSTDYFSQQPKRWNAKAVAALPVAVAAVGTALLAQSTLLLLAGGALAFALGLIASRQCRDRDERGKGLAIGGMILGAAALFLALVGLLMAA